MQLSKLSLMLGFLAASSPYIAVLGYSFISDYSLRLYVVFSVAGLYMALLEVALFSWAASMLFFLLQNRVAPFGALTPRIRTGRYIAASTLLPL